jgi:hypothetical protein
VRLDTKIESNRASAGGFFKRIIRRSDPKPIAAEVSSCLVLYLSKSFGLSRPISDNRFEVLAWSLDLAIREERSDLGLAPSRIRREPVAANRVGIRSEAFIGHQKLAALWEVDLTEPSRCRR